MLGSSQRDDSVDAAAVSRTRASTIVRRRSGGGGVLLWPDEFVWLDLEIPASDDVVERRRRPGDVVGGGAVVHGRLATYEPDATVHRGRLIRTRWSADVCFAGTGPGEVMVGGAKLVGISQRRTRHAARFQTMVHLRWRPDVVASLVAARPAVDDLAPLVKTCSAPADDDHRRPDRRLPTS